MKKRFLAYCRVTGLPSQLNFWVVIGLFTATTAGAQTIRYVKPDGSGNASSWAQASADLQAVINVSVAGDQVWVAAGTYKPGGVTNADRSLSFSMKNGVAIYGGFQGSEPLLSDRPVSATSSLPSSSTLSGDIGVVDSPDDNSRHVISNTGLDKTAILDGFVITAASIENFGIGGGGGMFNQSSSPTIRSCQFTNNILGYGTTGGGMFNDTGSSPVLTNCVFANNQAGPGGAIYSSASSSLTLTHCTFSYNNSAGGAAITGGKLFITGCSFNNNNGGASSSPSQGGAISIDSGSIVSNCLFASNLAAQFGGAIYIRGNPTVTNCTFRGNLASGFGTSRQPNGGAIYVSSGSPVITNCSFSNNISAGLYASSSLGGAIYNDGGTPIFINCSFGNNQAYGIGGAIYNASGTCTFTNCIIWGNTPNNITNAAGANVILTYTDTQDVMPGTGNISSDPLFVDAPGDNLRLRACSPAIDAGNNTANATPMDIAGSPRTVRAIDMGAYEVQGALLGLTAITQQPNRTYSIPAGGTLTATVSVTGSVSGYQWYKDNMALTGVASAALTLTNLTVADGGVYYVVVSSSCNSVTSTTASLLVNTGMYTIKSGTWDDASIWSLNRVPVSGDLVRLKHIVLIPAAYVAHARRVSYDSGQRLRLGSKGRLQLDHP